jgi:hypothetical protein
MPDLRSDENLNQFDSSETKIVEFQAELLPDHRRVHFCVKLSDVSQRPDLELLLIDLEGHEIARSIILGTIAPNLNFTLHLGSYEGSMPVKAIVRVSLNSNTLLDERTTTVT